MNKNKEKKRIRMNGTILRIHRFQMILTQDYTLAYFTFQLLLRLLSVTFQRPGRSVLQ